MGRRTTRWASAGKPTPPATVVEPDDDSEGQPDKETVEQVTEEPAEVEREPDPPPPAEQASPTPPSSTCLVRVRGPGGVIAATGVHQAGETIRMSRSEAESLGDSVEFLVE